MRRSYGFLWVGMQLWYVPQERSKPAYVAATALPADLRGWYGGGRALLPVLPT